MPASDPRTRGPHHPRVNGHRAQQARVAAEFPTTPPRLLALFPRPLTNPDGTRPLGTAHLQRALRQWVNALPRIDAPDPDTAGNPVPFPRDTITPYAFRHTFAQRHADAGTPLDTLKDLLGHDTVRTTLGYYRVTAKRKARGRTHQRRRRRALLPVPAPLQWL